MEKACLRSFALVLVAAVSLACGTEDTPPPSADSTGGDSSTGAGTTGSSVSATSSPGTEGLDTTAGPVSSTGMADGSFLDPSTDDGSAPLPNGGQCMSNADCESDACFQIPMLGGVCSECLMDSDCKMGTCSLDPTSLFAVCTDGGIGVMCDSDEGCMGDLVCAELINTAGLFPLDFCSECNDSTPCDKPQVCSPVYDLGNFQGYQGCVDPMSVPNGGGCPINGISGDGTVCQSGLCGVTTLLDLIPVGVCGECLTDEDCKGGTCMPGSADMSGLQGATCV